MHAAGGAHARRRPVASAQPPCHTAMPTVYCSRALCLCHYYYCGRSLLLTYAAAHTKGRPTVALGTGTAQPLAVTGAFPTLGAACLEMRALALLNLHAPLSDSHDPSACPGL